jgi:hypothetical protein
LESARQHFPAETPRDSGVPAATALIVGVLTKAFREPDRVENRSQLH